MDQIRASLHRLPAKTSIGLLRQIFALPALLARPILNDSVKPRPDHRSWMCKHARWENGWRGYWIGETMQKRAEKNDIIEELVKEGKGIDVVIFYVHGGGFRLGRPTMHMDAFIRWLTYLKDELGLRAIILSVRYGLAPKYKYPHSSLDVIDAYKYLTQDLAVPPQKIIMSGDSAGGALCLHALYLTSPLAQLTPSITKVRPVLPKLPRPAGLILVSPVVTPKTTSLSWKENLQYDYLALSTARAVAKDYVPSRLEEPSIFSPIEAVKLDNWLPSKLLIILGGYEVLRDDGIRLGERAREHGITVNMIVEPEQVHDWFVVGEVIEKNIREDIIKKGMQIWGEFVANVLGVQKEIGEYKGDGTSLGFGQVSPKSEFIEDDLIEPELRDDELGWDKLTKQTLVENNAII